MIRRIIRGLTCQLLGIPEVKVINRDSAVMRAVIAENAELRGRLNLPQVSSIQCVDGTMSRITYDLPEQLWASRVN